MKPNKTPSALTILPTKILSPGFSLWTMLTVQQLSNLLNIKGSTLYAWAAQNKIPYVKIHGLIRFQVKAIDEWLVSFSKPQQAATNFNSKNIRQSNDLERVIAQVKRQAYNSNRGKPGHGRTRKEGRHGI
jgi:excisionase family DNA binding protein